MSCNDERDKAVGPEMNQQDVDVDSESGNSNDDIDSDDEHEFDAKKAVSAIAKMVCTWELDPRSIAGAPFGSLLNALNPRFQVDFTAVVTECVAIFCKEKAKIIEKLGTFDGEISVSADVRGIYQEFVCISLHFIDENWSLKKWVIKFCSLEEPMDMSPWDAIVESLKVFGIKNKLSTVTLTSFYDDDTFDYVKEHVQDKKKLSLNGKLFWVHCCGYCISQMVQYAFGEVEGIIDNMRLLHNPKSPPLWYLTSHNLKKTLELWSMGEFSSKDVTDNYDVPSAEEWKRVEDVCKIVDSIHKVADGLFQRDHVTANLYLYLLHEIRAILAPISIQSESFEGGIAKGMLERLDKYWNDMFLVLAIAAVLDPRFKMKYVEFTCSEVWGNDDGISKAKTVSDAIHNLFDDYATRIPVKPPSSPSSSISMQGYQQFIQSQNPDMKSELVWYFEQPVLPWSDNFVVLDWWKTSSIQYPTLARMARDILAIPLSLTTSDDVYYTEPRPVDDRLTSLNLKLANVLVCTRSWFSEDSISTST